MKGLYLFARPATAALVLVVSASAFAQNTEDEAGDVSEVDKDRTGPLRDRVSPVSGHLFRKRGRFEASPGAALSLRDAFFTKAVFKLALTYHVTETFGVGLHGGYSGHFISSSAQICTTGAAGTGASRTCRSPSWAELDGRAPGKISLLGGLDLQWSPIYGKVALMAQAFGHFDMYGLVGPAFVMYTGPGNTAQSTVGGNIGIGMRFILNRFVAVRTELRDLIYVEQVVVGGSSLRNQFFFELGLSFFLPTSFEEG